MKICIYGAGAIGVFLGARLGATGQLVSAVARGATLAALRAHGLRLELAERVVQAPVNATDDPRELGRQDIVIIAVKGPAMPSVVTNIAPLIGPDTIVLTAMNGVPWWFFSGMEGRLAGSPLDTLDPAGSIAAAIPARQILGCVVHASCSTSAPGTSRHGTGHGLIVGEPVGGASLRVLKVSQLLEMSGFETRIAPRIQQDIWYKLWGNMTMNPVSAITGATADRVLDDELVGGFIHSVMREASAIGAAIGCTIAQSAEDRSVITRKLGAFRTSMLQDVDAGRQLEIDALLTVVREIAMRVDIATPNLDALLGLTRLFARTRGLYPG